MRRFAIRERDLEAGVRLLEIEGELDLAVADRLQGALDKAAENGSDAVLIDLGPCDFIDSTGIAVIVRSLNDDERSLAVFGASGGVQRVFAATGLDEHELFVADLAQARAALSLPDPA